MKHEERIEHARDKLDLLKREIGKRIVGHTEMMDGILAGLFSAGHVLIEGVPGLGKTLLVKTLSDALALKFSRVQFTPDLMPADIIGTQMVVQDESGDRHFKFQPGPIFTQMLLADEINRATPKTQSALLEAMAERQVSVGSHSYALDSLFLVMATQNPLEQEGTYPLPEAQLDRFLMHVNVDYPSAEAELAILRSVRNEAQGEQSAAPQISQQAIFSARQQALDIHMADAVEQYIVQLVVATRNAGQWDQQLDQWLDVGASPRATIALDRCSRAHAWLAGRDYVSPDDVQAVAHDVLRHRLIISFAAEAEGVARDQVIDRLIHCVPVA